MKLTETIVPYKNFGLATGWNNDNWGMEMVWINKGGWADDEELTECCNWDGQAWFPYFKWFVVISNDCSANVSDFQSTHTPKQNLNMHYNADC